MVNKELMMWLPGILLVSTMTLYVIIKGNAVEIERLIYFYGGILLFLGIIKWIIYWSKK